jgi:hypothetical protein
MSKTETAAPMLSRNVDEARAFRRHSRRVPPIAFDSVPT